MNLTLERDAAGTITSRIAGVPIDREGTVMRVEAGLVARGDRRGDFERTTAAANGFDDAPAERANHPVAALEAIAKERGWQS